MGPQEARTLLLVHSAPSKLNTIAQKVGLVAQSVSPERRLLFQGDRPGNKLQLMGPQEVRTLLLVYSAPCKLDTIAQKVGLVTQPVSPNRPLLFQGDRPVNKLQLTDSQEARTLSLVHSAAMDSGYPGYSGGGYPAYSGGAYCGTVSFPG